MNQLFFKPQINMSYLRILFCCIVILTSQFVIAKALPLTTSKLKTKRLLEVAPPNYIINQLVLDEIGKDRVPVKNLEDLNKKLQEYNIILQAQGKPLLYFGFTNNPVLINVPFFQETYKIQSASPANIREGYSKSFSNSETSNLGTGFEELRNTYEEDLVSKKERLFTEGLSGIEGKAILIAKYYYGLIKQGTDLNTQSASIQWLSAVDYKKSGFLENDPPIDGAKLRAHYVALKSAYKDSNLLLIETWFNYLMDKEIPNTDGMLTKSLNGANMDESEACKTLTTDELITKREEIEAVINKEGVTASDVSGAVLYNCFDIIASIDYTTLMKGIDILLLKNEFNLVGVVENLEVAILRLIHAISSDNYPQLFKALKQDNDALLNDLLSAIDDHSTNPFDGDNYTSLIQELLRIGNVNNGRILKTERAYLLTVLLKSHKKNPTEAVINAINEVLTFNLNPSEEGPFEEYLTNNENENLIELLKAHNHIKESKELLSSAGESLGAFFESRNEGTVYVNLLDVLFNPETTKQPIDNLTKLTIALNVMPKMFDHLPESSEGIYNYLALPEHNGLHNLLNTLHLTNNRNKGSDYEASVASFYKGITELFDKYGSGPGQDQIALMKWGIENEGINNDLESLFTNVLKNIPNEAVGQALYDFLTLSETKTTKNYHYYKKIIENVLSGEDAVVEFTKDFMGLVNTYGGGNGEDRLALIEYSFDDLLDTIIFWRSDKANLLTALFHDLSEQEAAIMIEKLKKGEYALFKRMWTSLANDANAEHFESFIAAFSNLFKYPESIVTAQRESYEMYLNEHQNYLNADPSTMIQIEGDFIPMASSEVFKGTSGINRYAFTSEIDHDRAGGDIIRVQVGIGHSEVQSAGFDPNSLIPETILEKYYKPFETVIVEFLSETKISDKLSFKKGDIIGVPAFYLAWMDGEISSRKLETKFRVGVDAMVIVASGLAIAGSGGAATPILLAGGEIIFALVDMDIALNKDELIGKYGETAVNYVEIANLIWGLGNLPGAIRTAPEGLMKLKLATGRMISPGVKAASGTLSEIRVGFRYFRENLPAILKDLENADPAKLEQLSTRLENAQIKFKRVLSTINNPTKATKALYGLVKDATAAVRYLRKAPIDLATMIKNNPGKFEMNIANDLLEVKQDGKILCKIDSDGVFSDIQFKIIPKKVPRNADPVLNRVKFKDESGNINEELVEFRKDENGEAAFWKFSNKMDGYLIKNSLIRSTVKENPEKFEINIVNDLLEVKQDGKILCKIDLDGVLYEVKFKIVPEEEFGYAIQFNQGRFKNENGNIDEFNYQFKSNRNGKLEFWKYPNYIEEFLMKNKAIETLVENNPEKFKLNFINDNLLEIKQDGAPFCKIDSDGVLSGVQFKIIPKKEAGSADPILNRAKFKDESGNINKEFFEFRNNENGEVAFWKLSNKMDGFLMKNKAISSLVESNPGKFEMNFISDDLLELKQNGVTFCKISPEGVLSEVNFKIVPEEEYGNTMALDRAQFKARNGNINEFDFQFKSNNNGEVAFWRFPNDIEKFLMKNKAVETLVKDNPGKFEMYIDNDLLEVRQGWETLFKMDSDGVLSDVKFKMIPKKEPGSTDPDLISARFKDESGNINEELFEFRKDENGEVAFWKLPNKMEGLLMKNRAVASLVENNPGKFEMSIANDLLELKQNGVTFCKISSEGVLSEVKFKIIPEEPGNAMFLDRAQFKDGNGNINEEFFQFRNNKNREIEFWKSPNEIDGYLIKSKAIETLVESNPGKFEISIADDLLELKQDGKTLCKIDSDGVLSEVKFEVMNEEELNNTLTLHREKFKDESGNISEESFKIIEKENGEVVFKKQPNNGGGFLEKNKAILRLVENNPEGFEMNFINNNLLEIKQDGTPFCTMDSNGVLFDIQYEIIPSNQVSKSSQVTMKTLDANGNVTDKTLEIVTKKDGKIAFRISKSSDDIGDFINVRAVNDNNGAVRVNPSTHFWIIDFSDESLNYKYVISSEEELNGIMLILNDLDNSVSVSKYEVINEFDLHVGFIEFQRENDALVYEGLIVNSTNGNGSNNGSGKDVIISSTVNASDYKQVYTNQPNVNVAKYVPTAPLTALGAPITNYTIPEKFRVIDGIDDFANNAKIRIAMGGVERNALVNRYKGQNINFEELAALRASSENDFSFKNRAFELFVNSGANKLSEYGAPKVFKEAKGELSETLLNSSMGSTIRIPEPLIASKSKKAVLTSIERNKQSVFVEIETLGGGYDLADISVAPNMNNVLFKPNSSFEVVEINSALHKGDNIIYVKLKYADNGGGYRAESVTNNVISLDEVFTTSRINTGETLIIVEAQERGEPVRYLLNGENELNELLQKPGFTSNTEAYTVLKFETKKPIIIEKGKEGIINMDPFKSIKDENGKKTINIDNWDDHFRAEDGFESSLYREGSNNDLLSDAAKVMIEYTALGVGKELIIVETRTDRYLVESFSELREMSLDVALSSNRTKVHLLEVKKEVSFKKGKTKIKKDNLYEGIINTENNNEIGSYNWSDFLTKNIDYEELIDGISSVERGGQLVIVEIDIENAKRMRYLLNSRDEADKLIMVLGISTANSPLVRELTIYQPINFRRGIKEVDIYNPYDGIYDADGVPLTNSNGLSYLAEETVYEIKSVVNPNLGIEDDLRPALTALREDIESPPISANRAGDTERLTSGTTGGNVLNDTEPAPSQSLLSDESDIESLRPSEVETLSSTEPEISAPNSTPTQTSASREIFNNASADEIIDLEFGDFIYIVAHDDGTALGKMIYNIQSENELNDLLRVLRNSRGTESTTQVTKYQVIDSDLRAVETALYNEQAGAFQGIVPAAEGNTAINSNNWKEYLDQVSMNEYRYGTSEVTNPRVLSFDPLNYVIPKKYEGIEGFDKLFAEENYMIAMIEVKSLGFLEKFPGLTIEELGAIRYYTRKGNDKLNPHLRGDPGKVITSFQRAYESLLNDALRKLPKSKVTEVYRREKSIASKTWKKGDQVSITEFASASTKRQVALQYILRDEESDLLLIIKDHNGVDINEISFFTDIEKEVLFESNSMFDVIEEDEMYFKSLEKRVRVLTLRQIN